MNLYYRILLKLILTVIGIVLIAATPALFQGMSLNVSAYISELGSLISNVTHPATLNYGFANEKYPLFPAIWSRWEYSLTLLLFAFFVAFLLALALTYVTMLLPRKAREKIKFILFLTESIPDILVIGLFTVVVLSIYKHTNILFFNAVAYGDEHIYFLPVSVLVILPTLLFFPYNDL